MALYNRQFVGKYAVVGYGNRLLNADTFRISISGEVIDITNVSVFDPLINRLPDRRYTPLGALPPTSKFNRAEYFANHGTPCQHLFGGQRKYKVNVTGKVYLQDYNVISYLPNFGDYVRIRATDAAPGLGVHPYFDVYCIVTNVEFSNEVRGYYSWTLDAEGTHEPYDDSSIVPTIL